MRRQPWRWRRRASIRPARRFSIPSWNGYTVLSPLATQAVLVIDMMRDQLAAVFKDHQWLEPPSGPPPYLQP